MLCILKDTGGRVENLKILQCTECSRMYGDGGDGTKLKLLGFTPPATIVQEIKHTEDRGGLLIIKEAAELRLGEIMRKERTDEQGEKD